MGLRDLFTGKNRQQSRIEKLIRKVENPYGQSADRFYAMEQLLQIGSEAALAGLLRRFNIAASKSIEDEEEKAWVFQKLSDLPPDVVLPAVKKFCLAHENIAWALRIIEDISNDEQEWDILNALLAQHPPGYERDPAKKLQLLTHVAEITDPRVSAIIAAYLNDNDEGTRFFCVETLFNIAELTAIKPLVERLTDPREDSIRLRAAILDGFVRLKWDVNDYHDRIIARLGPEYKLVDQVIQKRI